LTEHYPSKDLFRDQSLRYRMAQPQDLSVLLRGNDLPAWLGWALLLLFVALLAVLMTMDYRSTESARGIVVTSEGGQRVFAPDTASIRDIHVKAGDRVEPGQVLVTLVSSANDHRGRPARERELDNLSAQRALAHTELEVMQRQTQQRRHQLENQLQSEIAQRQLLDEALATLNKRTQLINLELESLADLLAQGAIARAELSRHEREQLAFRHQEQLALHERRRHEATIEELRQSLEAEELNWEASRLAISRRLQEIDQRQELATGRGVTTLVAEVAGTVTAIALDRGERVRASQTVLFLDRNEAMVQALVYAPSRVADRTLPGQAVMLRLDAFDYRHYGRLQGQVVSVARSALDPREYQLPVSAAGEPVFPIVVAIGENETATLNSVQINAGAALTADFIFETRPLIEFIFEPIFRLRGKVV